MSSEYVPSENQPKPDETLEALRKAVSQVPRFREYPAEDVARQLVVLGYLRGEPAPALVEELLEELEAEESFEEWYPYVSEAEPDRLRETVTRLMEAQQEAFGAARSALQPDVGSLDEYEQEEASERLEAALEDVVAILEGAQEDVRTLLEGGA